MVLPPGTTIQQARASGATSTSMKSTDRPSPDPATVRSPALASEADVARYYSFLEQVASGNPAPGDALLFAPDFIEHGADGDSGCFDFIRRLRARHALFPDGVWTVELLAGVGGMVICHTTLARPASTGTSVVARETVVVRMEAGRIAECWRVWESGHGMATPGETASPE